ncbi:MAG: right-handed parallel beta-helix repeat-containing protein [Rikenellaceae bacterium]
MRTKFHLIVMLLFATLLSCGRPPLEIYVAVDGDDSNVGTIEQPYATIGAARDYIRTLTGAERNRDIIVYLRGGEYRLSSTLRFGVEDSAPEGYNYIYKAYEDEVPVISSDVVVNHWGVANDLPEALSGARGKIYVTSMPKELTSIYALYDNGKVVRRSRREGFDIDALESVFLEGHGSTDINNRTNYKASRSLNVYDNSDRYLLSQFTFTDPEGVLKQWGSDEQVEVGFAPVPWMLNILPLKSVDLKSKTLYLTREANAPAGAKKSHTMPWVENVVEYLSEGSFATYGDKIYYYPKGGLRTSNIVAPRLMEYILVEGDIDYDGAEDVPVRGLTFEGLTFTRAARDCWQADHKGWGIQHDWDRFDHGNAMLRLRGAEGCTIDRCRFTNSSNSAIRLDLYAQNNTIKNSLIDYVGHMGILLCGYGPGTKDVNKNNTITNNLIHHVGEVYTHGAGIFVWQSGGNTISHNLIHNVPRKGVGLCGIRTPIMVKDWCDFDEASRTIRRHEIDPSSLDDYKAGKITLSEYWKSTLPYIHTRNNIVEFNEVYRALEMLADGSVLNVSGAGEGNIVRNNYIHHIASQASGVLRTDDWQRGTTFENNIIYMSNIAAFVHKGYNHIINNLVVDASVAEAIRWASYPDEEADYGSRVEDNIFYESGDRANFYRESYRASEGISLPHNSKTDNNLFWVAKNSEDAQTHINRWRERGIETTSVAADPLIDDVDGAIFTLSAESPAFKMGIKPIDISQIGLLDSYPAEYLKYDSDESDKRVNFHRQAKKKNIYDFW